MKSGPRVATGIAAIVFLFCKFCYASDELDVEAFGDHVRSKQPRAESIEGVRRAQQRHMDAVHAAKLVAIEELWKRIEHDWRKNVERLQVELAKEIQQANRDASLQETAYWLGMAGSTFMTIATTVDAMKTEVEAVEGSDRPDGSKAELNPRPSGGHFRRTITQIIELCPAKDTPCRTIRVETIVDAWSANANIPDTARSRQVRREIATIVDKKIAEGIVCWGNDAGCETGVAGQLNVKSSDEKRNGQIGAFAEAKDGTSQEHKYSKKVGRILWELADWTTPIPDLVILYTGKDPLSGESKSRMGAAVSASSGLFGPAGRIIGKGGRVIVKGGKIFFKGKVLRKSSRKIVGKLIKNMDGRTGREVFGNFRISVGGGTPFEQLGPKGIEKALRKTPFKWDAHSFTRMLERRTKRAGVNTPRDIVNILNSGVISKAGDGSIAIQSATRNIEIIVDVGSRTVKTIRPLKVRL